MAAYRSIREDSATVLAHLRKHISSHSQEHYYSTRLRYNRLEHSSAQTARFIYLNMTCFNGIFRVNRRGEFNVPKGSKDILVSPDVLAFRAIATALRGADLQACDFSVTLNAVKKTDFVYLDPPYPALNETAYFNHYTSDRFDSGAQEKLAESVTKLHNQGATFLMSNADVDSIRALYSAFNMFPIPVKRFVSCKGERTAVSELIIKNY